MKTAEEMYQYCLDNSFGNGVNRKWSLKHFSLIEQALQPDEDAIMCFIGLHNYVSSSKHDSNFAYAVTNKRIIMAQQKFVGKSVQTVSIDYVNDITLSTGFLFGVLTIDTMKETFNVGLNKEDANNINNAIHDILHSLKHKNQISGYPEQTAQNISGADEILKFKNLLDMGAITQEEYDIKKKEILGL